MGSSVTRVSKRPSHPREPERESAHAAVTRLSVRPVFMGSPPRAKALDAPR